MNVGETILFLFMSITFLQGADHVGKISLQPTQGMSRADLYVWSDVKKPESALVLVPGLNGNGEGLIRQKVWQDFARKNNMALVGVSFASNVDMEDERGYFFASTGSGELLLDGVRQAFGKDLPLLLVGFSAGAHFTSRFVEWKPERVLSWCAYASGFWQEPKPFNVSPPGLVGCGEEDSGGYGPSLIYFKQGRAAGKPWLWVSLAKTGHHTHPGFEQFVREYFQVILNAKKPLDPENEGIWVDIDRLIMVSPGQEHPALTAWIPDGRLMGPWKGIHKP